jgi:alpha-1,6-mannosyltransferase
VKTNPEWRVYILGGALCVALTMCSRHFGDRGGLPFMAWLTLACIAYLLATWKLFSTPEFPRRVVVIGLVLAAVSQLAFLRLPPGPNDDIHRYVWDGRLQRLGFNPYLVVPGDPAVKRLHTQETRNLNNPELTSPYPPGAQLVFRAVTAIRESVFALKLAFVICDFGIAIVVLDLLRTSARGSHLVLAYAWNPLLAIEVAGSGHIDILGALLLTISVAALARRWRVIAALTLGLAVAVKFLPIVLLPLYWKRVRLRDAMLAAGVVALLCMPFLNHGRIPVGSLSTYVQTFRFNGPVFAALDRVASPRLLAGLAVLVGFATSIWLRRRRDQWSPDVFAWPMAASLLCAPVVFPWYLLWFLPFLTSPATLLIIFWTVTIIPTYVMWHLSRVRGAWGSLPGWIMEVEYGALALAAAVIAWRRIIRMVALRSSAYR